MSRHLPIAAGSAAAPPPMDRRRFLSLFGATAAASATALACSPSLPEAQAKHAAVITGSSGGAAKRTLVVIELQGGNDGLAMLQPLDDGVFEGSRSALLAPSEDLIRVDDTFGWHPALAGIAKAGAAAMVGIGSNQPSFSHFEMENRWWRGDSRPNGDWTTGVFGRMCDQLDRGDPVTGLSLAGGPSPSLLSEKAVTVGLANPEGNWFLQEDAPWFTALRKAHHDMSAGASSSTAVTDGPAMLAARKGLTDARLFAESLASASLEDDEIYPWTDLGQQLRFAAEVLSLDVGLRVLHVRQGGYDTHSGQQWRYPELMSELNDATTVFVDDLKRRGLWQDTLIMTTSEFGRRVPANDGGTDHGGASTCMLIGEGLAGVHGQAPNLRRLDDGNVTATARFEDYYATVADGWFGLDTTDLLPKGSTPVFKL